MTVVISPVSIVVYLILNQGFSRAAWSHMLRKTQPNLICLGFLGKELLATSTVVIIVGLFHTQLNLNIYTIRFFELQFDFELYW